MYCELRPCVWAEFFFPKKRSTNPAYSLLVFSLKQELLVSSLRYWMSEYHLDGFRIQGADYLLESSSNNRPPVVEALCHDSLLGGWKRVYAFDCSVRVGELGSKPWGHFIVVTSHFLLFVSPLGTAVRLESLHEFQRSGTGRFQWPSPVSALEQSLSHEPHLCN